MTRPEFLAACAEFNLSLKQFSRLTDIPYDTIGKWGKYDRPVPAWVTKLFQLARDNRDLTKRVDALQAALADVKSKLIEAVNAAQTSD